MRSGFPRAQEAWNENGAAQPCAVRTIDCAERVLEVWGVLPADLIERMEELLIFSLSNG